MEGAPYAFAAPLNSRHALPISTPSTGDGPDAGGRRCRALVVAEVSLALALLLGAGLLTQSYAAFYVVVSLHLFERPQKEVLALD